MDRQNIIEKQATAIEGDSMFAEVSTTDVVVEVAKQIPALAALIYLVLQFLWSIKEMNETHEKSCSARDTTLYQLVNATTDALKGCNETLGRAVHALDRFDSWKARQDRKEVDRASN